MKQEAKPPRLGSFHLYTEN